ncbi:hypothetical protein K0U83_01590 [bacterium]|nr:hypothetical protein [bacterium]
MSILSDEEYTCASHALARLQDMPTWTENPDGTWTEHPALFPFMEGFEAHMAIAVGEFNGWSEYRWALCEAYGLDRLREALGDF